MKWSLEKVEANKLLLIVRVWTETLEFYHYYHIFPSFKNGVFLHCSGQYVMFSPVLCTSGICNTSTTLSGHR